MKPSGLSIDIIEHASAEQQQAVHAFWQRLGVSLPESVAQQRLQAIVALASDDAGEIQAVATAPVQVIDALAGTAHFIWRNLVAPDYRGTDVVQRMYAGFYRAANERFQAQGGAIGIFTEMADEMLEGPGVPARACIDDIPLYLLTHISDQYRARVSYFEGARISAESSGSTFNPLRELPDGYVMQVSPQGASGDAAEASKALWLATQTLPEEQFEQRLKEVYVTTWAPDGSLCGILTAYRQRLPRLEAAMHWVRALVSPEHRQNNIPALMCARFLADLQSRADAGEDVGSLGMLAEVHSPTIRIYRNDAVWPATDAAFIGVTPTGYHLRASYLQGLPAIRTAAD